MATPPRHGGLFTNIHEVEDALAALSAIDEAARFIGLRARLDADLSEVNRIQLKVEAVAGLLMRERERLSSFAPSPHRRAPDARAQLVETAAQPVRRGGRGSAQQRALERLHLLADEHGLVVLPGGTRMWAGVLNCAAGYARRLLDQLHAEGQVEAVAYTSAVGRRGGVAEVRLRRAH
jgi:hypothetical protein